MKKLKQIAISTDIYSHLALLATANHRTLSGQFASIFEDWCKQNNIPKLDHSSEELEGKS